jgi:hypothetical protein
MTFPPPFDADMMTFGRDGKQRFAAALDEAGFQGNSGTGSMAVRGYAEENINGMSTFPEQFERPRSVARSTEMTRRERQELERKLAQTHRLALEPTDALTRERLAQRIEDLEFQLLAYRLAA